MGADRGVQARFRSSTWRGCDAYKSSWRTTTAIVIFQQRHRGVSSKNTQISIPKAAGSALSTPRTSTTVVLARSPFLFLLREFRDRLSGSARIRPCSDRRAVRVCSWALPHVCTSGYAYKSGPPAREMYSEAEVASTYRRTISFPPLVVAPRATSFPLSSAI